MTYLVENKYINGDKYFDKYFDLEQLEEYLSFVNGFENQTLPDSDRHSAEHLTVKIEE